DKYYNSLNFTLDNFERNQTPFTPNVLDIYLLKRTLDHSKGIDYIYDKLQKRKREYESFLGDFSDFNFLIDNKQVRSDTVFAIKHDNVEEVRRLARESSILLGSGYGELKNTTFRIANFPAIKKREVEKLRTFFKTHFGH
ncbi:MAG: alanine--glyoxylate aminotransferase family protein, partial [Cyclobacteriaceae bacterium]